MCNSVVEKIRSWAQMSPDRLAIVSRDDAVDYRTLYERVAHLAYAFRSNGVSAGDAVMLAAVNRPEFIYSYFAIHLVGGIAVPFRISNNQGLLDRMVEQVRPRLIVSIGADGERGNRTYQSLCHFDARLNRHATDPFAPIDLTRVADIIYTSGSTGDPKGVVLTHLNLLSAASHINEAVGTTAEDVEVLSLPLNHSFGLGRLRCTMLAGATVTLLDGLQEPGRFFAAVAHFKATGFASVPAGVSSLVRFGERGLGRFKEQLKYVEIGSAPMVEAEKLKLMALLPSTRLMMHYGMTEASRSAFLDLHAHKNRLSSIGKAAAGVRIKVRDGLGGLASVGELGSIWVAGDHVASGYWQNEELTKTRFSAGWVDSGDIGYMDHNGFLNLTGRADDAINSAGFSFHPIDVEKVFLQHPAIADVACVGLDDPAGIVGEVPTIALVLGDAANQPSTEDLKTFGAERLESYKQPRFFCWLDSLPRSETGKVKYGEVRERILQLQGVGKGRSDD